jgi:AbrB family looped-hinge helix DNA binding protein
MSQLIQNNKQEEWLKVLGKGMVTLPKKWRDEMGIENGDIVKAKKEGEKIVIETQTKITAPYRIYSADEIKGFLADDNIPDELVQKAQRKISVSQRT